jgi:ADP-ribose pyrophosphatase YjhB (NUDIX family)
MKFETKMEFDGRIASVGAILRNKEGFLLLQKSNTDMPAEGAEVTGFGGFTLIGETAYDTLKRALVDEIKLKIDKNGAKPIVFDYVEVADKPDTFHAYVYISEVDESKLELDENVVKVKFLTQIKKEDKSDWLLNITDEDLPK